jgi:hypothetical protein
MPDGGDPCKGYAALKAERDRLTIIADAIQAERDRLQAALEQIIATERDDDSIVAADRCAEIARRALGGN